MSCMFSGCSSLESLDLSSFNTTENTNIEYIFSDCKSLKKESITIYNKKDNILNQIKN
jgi:surface protein